MTIEARMWRELGLSDGEYQRLLEALGREPSPTELAMFSVEWSEHCGYPRSRPLLQLFPKPGDVVGHSLCVLLCGQMVQRDLRIVAPGQLGDENKAVFPVADDLAERHQDASGMRFGHGNGPHDCQV